MALKLQAYIQRGLIDNRQQGVTHLKLWFEHSTIPTEIILQGNCRRDIAGCLLSFTSSQEARPLPEVIQPLFISASGTMGDMTGSLKRLVQLPNESQTSSTITNLLSLEWFSQSLGRLLIESSNFEIECSAPEWVPTEEEDLCQKTENELAMSIYAQQICQMACAEENLKELEDKKAYFLIAQNGRDSADILTDIYAEVCEKYGFSDNSEVKRAYALGWTHVLDAMAYSEEANIPIYFAEEDKTLSSDEMPSEEIMSKRFPLFEDMQRFSLQLHEWLKDSPITILNPKRYPHQLLKATYTIIEKLSVAYALMGKENIDKLRILLPLNEALENTEHLQDLLKILTSPHKKHLFTEMTERINKIHNDLQKLHYKINLRP